jgi:hypothetical protein
MRAAALREAVVSGEEKEFPAVFPVVMKEEVPAVREEDSMAEGGVKEKSQQCLSRPRRFFAVSSEGRSS